uniref:Four and a half LIM domains 3b n=1 Tax=Callorhinchus milii TaxID=7868 RepID=A0A4W3JER2_CALMI
MLQTYVYTWLIFRNSSSLSSLCLSSLTLNILGDTAGNCEGYRFLDTSLDVTNYCFYSLISLTCQELFYEDRHYHEHCFRCYRCDRSLADEPFTCQEEELLCNDCYCSEFSSKCVACDKVVMPGTRKLEYNGSTWHESCFICHTCEQPIGSKAFIPNKDDIYCVPCYENHFAPRCFHCKKALTKGGVTYHDEAYHKECFVCNGCNTPLAGQHFTSRDDSPYCLACFGSLYAKKCAACSKPITGFGGGKYISFEDRQWHQSCFSCSRCEASLVGKGFFPEKDDILCPALGRSKHSL